MPDPVVIHHSIRDRPMVTLNLDVGRLLEKGEIGPLTGLKGAIVRIRGEATESEAEQLGAEGQRRIRDLLEALKAAGANKIVGPQLKTVRERRKRSETTLETDPAVALGAYLDARDVDEDLRPEVLKHAERVMAGC
jgi:hypothetical protein